MSKILMLALLAVPATLLVACDAQVDADHQGTALAQLSGTVRNTRTQSVTDTEVVVVWINSSGDPDVFATGAVDVSGSFPSQFSLSIYAPPDALALNDDGTGAQFAVGTIIAHPTGGDPGDATTYLGAETNHLLVYVPADVPAGSNTSYLLHSTPKAGFHLYGVKRLTDDETAEREACVDDLVGDDGEDPSYGDIVTHCGGKPGFDDLVPQSTDLATPLDIELIDDPSAINFPNWT